MSSDGWKALSATWHGFTAIANISQIGVMARMPDLIAKPNGKVLLAIALSDIYMSMLNVVDDFTSFYDLDLLPTNSGKYIDGLQEACNMSAVQTRYYVTAFACFERFKALCYPYKHGVNMAVRNIIMLLVAVFLHLMNWSLI